ncbi:uncharacterized protein SPSC_02989 [Sporisorium scitamineum]|uniref:Uncharacterized protein n=1 Tax=Sporisorium scitamineum TaxID=49012 RepID=A0A0F7RTB5_9BASI|nr:hypothetical protein [Sporisorium scitamineum]CDS82169.1 uncharacterized protein SPSC_02989 [Sporisorium scitamineum]
MNWLSLTSALTLTCLALNHAVLGEQHRMIKLHTRQQAADTKQDTTPAADPGLQLTEDSDADLSLHYDESMRLFMRAKAESVIASHAGNSFSAYEAECILSGSLPSLHPGSLSNVSWTMDMFEFGTTLPTASSPVAAPQILSLMSTDSAPASKTLAQNVNNIIDVDHLLDNFFHADTVKSTFNKIQAETDEKLDKQAKKAIIKDTAPVLHKTIEKVASHRGWGIQDERFAQMHLDDDPELQMQMAGGKEQAQAFRDYNTFVKTMRSALITSVDAEKDEVQEQQEAPRKDPAAKA